MRDTCPRNGVSPQEITASLLDENVIARMGSLGVGSEIRFLLIHEPD
ncbi:hypothetical protein [Roseomonas xinghualingensis]|nr:hypothetical protein [Roseomonas sp. SXEYE001]MCV4207290.1 hypothetical protein [Roseomonas sp. SXEYE001]